VEYCRSFLREWKKLTKSQKFVCIDGENDGEITEKFNRKGLIIWRVLERLVFNSLFKEVAF
jgi:hypothetical protein